MAKSKKQMPNKNSRVTSKKEKEKLRVSQRLIKKQSSLKSPEKPLQKKQLKLKDGLRSCVDTKKEKTNFKLDMHQKTKHKLKNVKTDRVINLTSPVKKETGLDIFDFEDFGNTNTKKVNAKSKLPKESLHKKSKKLKASEELSKYKLHNGIKKQVKNYQFSFLKHKMQSLPKTKKFKLDEKVIRPKNKSYLAPDTAISNTLNTVKKIEENTTDLPLTSTYKPANTSIVCSDNVNTTSDLEECSHNNDSIEEFENCQENIDSIADLKECSKISQEATPHVQSCCYNKVYSNKKLLVEESDVSSLCEGSHVDNLKFLNKAEKVAEEPSTNISINDLNQMLTLDKSSSFSFSSPANFSTPATRKKLRKTIAATGVQNLFGFAALLKKENKPIIVNSSPIKVSSNKKPHPKEENTNIDLQIDINEEECTSMHDSTVFTDSYDWTSKELPPKSDNESSCEDEDEEYVPFSKIKVKKEPTKPKATIKQEQELPDFSEYMSHKLVVE